MRIPSCLRVAYIAVAWAKLESKQMRIYPLGLLTKVDPTTTRRLSCLHYGYRRVSARARGRKVRNHPARHGNPLPLENRGLDFDLWRPHVRSAPLRISAAPDLRRDTARHRGRRA